MSKLPWPVLENMFIIEGASSVVLLKSPFPGHGMGPTPLQMWLKLELLCGEVAKPMGDASRTYEATMNSDLDCNRGLLFIPRSVTMLATIMIRRLVVLMIEKRATQKLEFREEDESVRRRVGHREEWMCRVITLHKRAELTLYIE